MIGFFRLDAPPACFVEGLIAVIAICRKQRLFVLMPMPFFTWVISAFVSGGHPSGLNGVRMKSISRVGRESEWLAFKMDV